jgi:hypothetical protein
MERSFHPAGDVQDFDLVEAQEIDSACTSWRSE